MLLHENRAEMTLLETGQGCAPGATIPGQPKEVTVMPSTIVRCSTCGKPLMKVPAYLGDGEGTQLFQCESCFYPKGALDARPYIPDYEGSGSKLSAIIEDWTVSQPADAA